VPWPSDIEHELACPLGHEVTERLSLDCCPWLVVDVIHGQLNVSFVIVGGEPSIFYRRPPQATPASWCFGDAVVEPSSETELEETRNRKPKVKN
jgi:hypothetical protein